MLPGVLPALPITAALLPTASAVGSAVPETFAQVLGGIAPSTSQAAPPLLNEFASQYGVSDPSAPLSHAGLPQPVAGGEFTVHLRRVGTASDGTHVVNEERQVQVVEPDEQHGTSLQDVAASLNTIPGLKASVADGGRLVVTSTDKSLQFRFGEDSSGLLQALGTGKTPLHKAFDDFVGNSMYGQMLASMRKTQGKPKYLYGGRTEEVFQGQLDQQLVKSLTSAKGGQLADAMYQQQFNALRR